MNPLISFAKKHYIISNLLLMIVAAILLGWIALWAVGIYTGHGNVVTVPNVSGQSLTAAQSTLRGLDFEYEVSDSIYSNDVPRGYVMEQMPPAGNIVKKGRTIYLTINAYSAKKITIPDLTGASRRQALSTLKSLGFTNVSVEEIPSDYKDLVLGVRSMGVMLRGGTKIATNAALVVEVGSGNTGSYGYTAEEDSTLTELDEAVWENMNETDDETENDN
jgi:beta-lactam-binding protein with PASTA domain